MAAPQLQTITSEKQTCSICLQTIRKNSVWWHETECHHPHYFHWQCWHDYRKHTCAKEQGDWTSVPCPVCRHPQMPKGQFIHMFLPILERCSREKGDNRRSLSWIELPFNEEISYSFAQQADSFHSGRIRESDTNKRSKPNIWTTSQIRRQNHCFSHAWEVASWLGRHDI